MSKEDRLTFALRSGEIEIPKHGNLVVLRAVASAALTALAGERLHCEQSNKIEAERLDAQGIASQPQLEIQTANTVIVNTTRDKAETRGQLARGLSLLPPGAPLLINGNKADGIDSLTREIAGICGLRANISKSHGRLISVQRPSLLPTTIDTWAAAASLRKNADDFWTKPGMFSPDRADEGSIFLAEVIREGLAKRSGFRLKGSVADLGAGWGYLSSVCLEADSKITDMSLYEVEYSALEAARRNVRDPRARFLWSDVSKLKKDGVGYDAVITNPPFHSGRAADPSLGQAFIFAAARILKQTGCLLMVANRHLPYEAALDAAFRQWKPLRETREFKVMTATSPRRA
ncbi:MAG: methyltransferase [Pseudomonadota bacterium]